jgi:hypothetical protein
MRDIFVWVPLSDGRPAEGTTWLTPSHNFVFDSLPDGEVGNVDFAERGRSGWQEIEWRLCGGGAKVAFSSQLAQFLGDPAAESSYASGQYQHLGLLRFFNHHPYPDSGRLHIILIPQ